MAQTITYLHRRRDPAGEEKARDAHQLGVEKLGVIGGAARCRRRGAQLGNVCVGGGDHRSLHTCRTGAGADPHQV